MREAEKVVNKVMKKQQTDTQWWESRDHFEKLRWIGQVREAVEKHEQKVGRGVCCNVQLIVETYT